MLGNNRAWSAYRRFIHIEPDTKRKLVGNRAKSRINCKGDDAARDLCPAFSVGADSPARAAKPPFSAASTSGPIAAELLPCAPRTLVGSGVGVEFGLGAAP
jgi:hypothetical protein